MGKTVNVATGELIAESKKKPEEKKEKPKED